MAKILLVEDDRAVGKSIADYLSKHEKHSVEWAQDGASAEECLRFYKYELLILDWNLPHKSGLDLLKAFREGGGTASALMLTANSKVAQRTQGLDSGADDYLCKPFAMDELAARVRALLRRGSDAKQNVQKKGSVVVDSASHKVTSKGEPVHLTALEFSLLEFLMRHKGEVFSPEALLDRVWDSASDAGPDMVRATVKRIRHKLGEDGDESMIRNVYGKGYIIDA